MATLKNIKHTNIQNKRKERHTGRLTKDTYRYKTKRKKMDMLGRGGKLMRLGFPNRIIVVKSNSDSKFDCQFWSDSDFNNNFESTFVISISILSKFDLILINVN